MHTLIPDGTAESNSERGRWMSPGGLTDNRQARTLRSAPSSSTSLGASKRATSRIGSMNSG